MEVTAMEVDYDPLPISRFPDEILLEILANLDCDALKRAALVCKKWNDVIGSSARTMKKFILNLQPTNLNQLEAGFISVRKHRNITIHFEKDYEGSFEVLEQFDVSQVQCASIHRYNGSINAETLKKVFLMMPLVEHVSFVLIDITIPEGFELEPLNLPKHKHLRIYPGCCQFLKMFNPKQISELRVDESASPASHSKELIEFLHKAENLQTLKLNKMTFNEIFQYESKFPVKLNKFDMLYFRTVVSDVVGNNFSSFLRTQKFSLTSLDLNGMEMLPDSVYETIFNHLTVLKKLTLDGSYLPKNKEFYQLVKANESLRTLVLNKSFSSDEAAKGILGKCPEIVELSLNFSIGNKINHIAKYNPKLVKLTIGTLQRSVDPELKLNNLKILSTSHLGDFEHLLSLIKSSPKLMSLKISEGRFTDDIIDVMLKQQASLTHLQLMGCYEQMKCTFDMIKQNYGNLKTLNLVMRFRTTTSVLASATISFGFPKDAQGRSLKKQESKFMDCIWDVKETNFKKCLLCSS